MRDTKLERDALPDPPPLQDGKCTSTDGPTASPWAKDLIADFWPVEMQSRGEAMEWA